MRQLLRSLFQPRSVAIGPFTLYLDPSDAALTPEIAKGIYEPVSTKVIKQSIEPGMHFVDVGANIGYFSFLAAARGAHVTAFEPSERSAQYLKKTIARNHFPVVLIEEAVTDTVGNATLYLGGDNHGDNRLYKKPGMRPVTISTTTLDREIDQPIDFLKIDAQGCEALVLRGAQSIIKRSPRINILLEYWPRGLAHFGDPAEIFTLLAGFKLTNVDDENRVIEAISITDLDRYTPENGLMTNLLCERV